MTLSEFIQQHGLKFEAHEVDSRPDGLMDDSMYHFRCRITLPPHYEPKDSMRLANARSMGLYFSMGSAHAGKVPELAEVLDCMASDAAGYENAQGFEDWASEYGYGSDSRKGERIYRAVKRQAEQLKRVLGQNVYNNLLWKVQRD